MQMLLKRGTTSVFRLISAVIAAARIASVSAAAAVTVLAAVISVDRPRSRGARHDDRGSIGEWVMILVMAVGIVLFIWSIAQPMLGEILRNALSKLFR